MVDLDDVLVVEPVEELCLLSEQVDDSIIGPLTLQKLDSHRNTGWFEYCLADRAESSFT